MNDKDFKQLVKSVKLGKRPDQAAAAFAVQVFDSVIAGQGLEEFGEAAVVKGG